MTGRGYQYILSETIFQDPPQVSVFIVREIQYELQDDSVPHDKKNNSSLDTGTSFHRSLRRTLET